MNLESGGQRAESGGRMATEGVSRALGRGGVREEEH